MDSRVKELIKQGDYLFSKKQSFNSLCQEIADNFYVERADFTVSRSLGMEFADHLMTGYPTLARRDLGNSFSSMLRTGEWFHMHSQDVNKEDLSAKQWLEHKTAVMRRAMYAPTTRFVRATKEGDHDFAAFGQNVISVEFDKRTNDLLYRCWHLRDVAWIESYNGKLSCVHRKWKPTARELSTIFSKNIHERVRKLLDKEPYCEINCVHVVVSSEDYDGYKTPYVSIYIDVDNQHVMEETGIYNPYYNIPRWQTVAGSQYAYSPATVIALPDARLIQSMTLALLEAGEKAVNPPMLAVQEAIRSDIDIRARGITWVDREYDERLGEVLRPLTQDKSGIPFGMDLRNDIREMISEAFYLNKLTLPPQGNMTATEVSQRVQEYIRQALPIFEPLESEYNGGLCNITFDLCLRNGLFGSLYDIPPSLRGQDIQFRFESPLQASIEMKKSSQFAMGAQLLAQAAQLDPSVAVNVDINKAFRDAFLVTSPSAWLREEEEVNARLQAQQQQAQAQQMIQAISQGADAAHKVGQATQSLQGIQ